MNDQELSILARWMDEKKGGVFATGDHEKLGASLCSRIPRVRSMRKWTKDVPLNFGADRHDTLMKGHDGYYTFNDESDDIPMPISLRSFSYRSWSPFLSVKGPHPVLCGKKGPIKILPDHPHEGEVIEPVSKTQNFSFPGYADKPEYPVIDGIRETPYIIATAQVQGDHTDSTDLNKGYAKPKTFGAIGAYNGHAANVGRVVVDSTWHHWFDVNLIGRPTGTGEDTVDPVNSSDPKAQGFLYSSEGRAALAQIQNYFRNVAIWLASPEKQSCMFFRATWWGTMKYPLAEQLNPKMALWELGGYALDALGRTAGQCTTRHWILDILHPVWKDRLVKPLPNPCLTCPPIDALEHLVLGSIVREILEVAYEAQAKDDFAKEDRLARAMSLGIANGSKTFLEMFTSSLKSTTALLKELEAKPAFKEQKFLTKANIAAPQSVKKSRKSK
jgi:hypothetical protein